MVPITVVEVEGRNEMCYDVDANIVYEACWGRGEGMFFTSRSLDAHGGSRKDKGWYYFTPRVSIKESRSLFTMGPSSIKGWKEKFFFVDDTKWERGDVEVELLSSWKAKKANQNKYSLNEDEEEEVGKLVREGGKLVNIMYLTSADCIEVAGLYGPSALSEVEMDKFLNAIEGVAIPKKPRKKSKASTKERTEVGAGKELVPSTSARVEEVRPRLELKRNGSEQLGALQKKKTVVEQEVEGAEVRAPSKGKGLVPPLYFQSSLFDAKNATGARRFINATFSEVDKRQAKEEVLKYCGATVVKHALESVSWVNALAQEFMKSVKDHSLLQRQCEQLQKENEELEKKNKDMQEPLDKVLPTVILAFIDCRKKVKAKYPEVNITKITFGEQEEGVEENGESMSADFRPEIKLRWDHDEEGRTVFPPHLDFKFVVVEEEEAEVDGVGVEENQPPHPVEVHSIPYDEEQPPLPAEQSPLPTEQQPPQPSPLVE
ncbi:hypothetical protein SLEP1_g43720 [Rubroshorea leprosula]|uniref:Uncharacterized protein n=1 Tax=Rubroshorea leprosula TaxID=152421 RepID=A0AAV5LFI9_9ROSI|nr:hypothetical protein SLEP1_g43720 [Rubroshorea leprosula]